MFKKILSIFIFQLILVNSIALSKVIYDKNGILITDYETEVFKKIYSQDIQRNISTAEAIKEYVLVIKIVSQVVSNNPDLINLIDNNLLSQIGEKNFENQIIKNYFRYKKIKNLYISQYIKDQFDIDELRESLNEFKELNIPINKNNCNTYDQFYNFKDNNDFFVFLLEKFKNDTNDFVFTIEGITYQACIDDAILKSLQSNIYLYLNQKILSIIRSSIQR
jgi:hypothetical protein